MQTIEKYRENLRKSSWAPVIENLVEDVHKFSSRRMNWNIHEYWELKTPFGFLAVWTS